MKKRALLSVTDKSDIAKFAAGLVGLGWEIVSTGGTAKLLKEAGVPVILVEEVTGFPEMMDGRLKTLHPKIFGGILADRSKPEHMQALADHGIEPIDLVCVNLYDFEGKPSIEEIDIGGPSLLRAAAKNSASVIVVTYPSDYDRILQCLKDTGSMSSFEREMLAEDVFDLTGNYDLEIAVWMCETEFLKTPVAAEH